MGDDRLDLVELLAGLALGDFHIVTVLEIHPELRGGAEGLAETQRGIGCDPGRFRGDARCDEASHKPRRAHQRTN